MMGLEDYLRWLGRKPLKIPQSLKNILMSPVLEMIVGMYCLVFGGIMLILSPFVSPGFSLLTGIQLLFATLVGFFLFTHGIYRAEKEDEA